MGWRDRARSQFLLISDHAPAGERRSERFVRGSAEGMFAGPAERNSSTVADHNAGESICYAPKLSQP